MMNKVCTAVTLLVMGIPSITLPGCASDAMKRSSAESQLISLYYSHGVEVPVDSVLEVQEDGWARFMDSGGATYSFRIGDAEMKLLRTEVTSDRFTGELSQQYRKSWADAAELEVRTAHVQTVIPCDAAGPALRELLAMIQAIVVSEIGDVRRDFRSIPCPQ